MAIYKATILTSWAGAGVQGDPYRPKIADDYSLASCSDSTGQEVNNLPPEPNLFLVDVILDGNMLANIEANPAYQVLASEEIKNA